MDKALPMLQGPGQSSLSGRLKEMEEERKVITVTLIQQQKYLPSQSRSLTAGSIPPKAGDSQSEAGQGSCPWAGLRHRDSTPFQSQG